VSKESLIKIYDYFHAKTGITFDTQMSIFESKLKVFCRKHGYSSFSALLSQIKLNAKLEQELTNHLTTNETYFFREIKQIEELIKTIKEEQRFSKVDILCAPCATGEEPYSISIMLLEAGVTNFNLTGIDINSEAIQKAKEAKYTSRHIKNLSQNQLKTYFSHQDGLYILNDEIKKHTSLKVANIFDKDFSKLGKFDYIFSRNMLIYFKQETKLKAKKILENMRKNSDTDIFLGHADLFV